MFRKDRKAGLGGGVMCYARECMRCCVAEPNSGSARDGFEHELLWLIIRPPTLPSPISVIVLVIVYCPPWYSAEMKRSLVRTITLGVDFFAGKFSSACFLILGDFNLLDINFFSRLLHFKQLVTQNTRANRILDMIFTNFKDNYNEPIILPPLGRSDHNSVFLSSEGLQRVASQHRQVKHRVLSDRAISDIATEISRTNWTDYYYLDDSQLQSDILYTAITKAVDLVAPVQVTSVRMSDKPWVTGEFKDLILQRDTAYRRRDMPTYNRLRNRINRMRNLLRKNFIESKVEKLKKSNPKQWWTEVKSLSGFTANQQLHYGTLNHHGSVVSEAELPNIINNAIVAVSAGIGALSNNDFEEIGSRLTEHVPDDMVVSEFEVFRALCGLNKNKASLCDSISNKLLRGLAIELAAPICALINNTLRTGQTPTQWRMSRI